MQTVQNRLAALNHAKTIETKISELTIALNTCERVLKLFQDEDFPLRKDALNSPLYIKAFTSLYISVGRLLVKVRPGYKDHVKKEMNLLIVVINSVVNEFGEKRCSLGQTIQTAFDYSNPGHIRDRLTNEKANLYEGGTLRECKTSWCQDVKQKVYDEMQTLKTNILKLLSELE